MNLKEQYINMYNKSVRKISSDNYEMDPMIHSETDDRFGLSLIIRPPIAVKTKIQEFLNELKSIEPHQYYYPNSDIHITVISIISCYSGLKLSTLNVPKYVKTVQKSLKNKQGLTINFKGVTASPSCLMIQGFIENGSLNGIRESVRESVKNSNLEQSMDERYVIQTAHATVFRFGETLKKKSEFLKLVEKYRNHDFGTFQVDKLELTYNDWYHRKKLVTKLHEFKMANRVLKA